MNTWQTMLLQFQTISYLVAWTREVLLSRSPYSCHYEDNCTDAQEETSDNKLYAVVNDIRAASLCRALAEHDTNYLTNHLKGNSLIVRNGIINWLTRYRAHWIQPWNEETVRKEMFCARKEKFGHVVRVNFAKKRGQVWSYTRNYIVYNIFTRKRGTCVAWF